MVALWRLGLGPWINIWPEKMGQIMVLTHTGRKSGLPRKTPVNYAIVDGEIYCTAGFGGKSDWYRNLKANPAVEVWLPDGWWAGKAEEVLDEKARMPLLRAVLIASGFASKAFGEIDPRQASDEDLAKATQGYKLFHIQRTEARTGKDGPGDLSWVWILATTLAAYERAQAAQAPRGKMLLMVS